MKTGVTHYYALGSIGSLCGSLGRYAGLGSKDSVTCKLCLKKMRKTHPAKTSAPDQDEKAEQGSD